MSDHDTQTAFRQLMGLVLDLQDEQGIRAADICRGLGVVVGITRTAGEITDEERAAMEQGIRLGESSVLRGDADG